MAKKLKLDEAGHVVVQDGKPVYVDDAGKEATYDIDYSDATIARLNSENQGLRKKATEAEAALQAFQGIEDPEAARAALETVANLDEGSLVTAKRVEEIKEQAKRSAEASVAAAAKTAAKQLEDLVQERDALRNDLYGEKVGGSFSRSKFINEKCSIPADLVQARFGSNFKVKDGQVVGYDANGAEIYSKTRGGELASFEEAIEILIDAYPDKERILKGTGNSGAGSEHGAGGPGPRAPKGNLTGTKQERVEAIRDRFPKLAENER